MFSNRRPKFRSLTERKDLERDEASTKSLQVIDIAQHLMRRTTPKDGESTASLFFPLTTAARVKGIVFDQKATHTRQSIYLSAYNSTSFARRTVQTRPYALALQNKAGEPTPLLQ